MRGIVVASMVVRFVKSLRQRCLDGWWSLVGQAPPRQVLSADEWLRSSGGGKSYPVRDAFQVDVPAHATAGITTVPPEFAAKRIEYPADRVVVIPNGRVVSRLGLIVTPDDVQLHDLSGAAFAGLFEHGFTYEGMLPPARRLRGRVAVLASCMSQRNYYHWTAEILPRIRQLEATSLAPDYYLIPGRHRYQRDSLAWLGVARDRLRFMGRYTHYQADELIVPSLMRMEISPVNVADLRRRAAETPWSQARSAERVRIYIARRRRGVRRVINERELLTALKPLGFQRHYLEDYNVRRQIELFQRADFVVGPHGAGLVNLLYCRIGTKVIELATPARPKSFFADLAHHAGLDYLAYFGAAVDQRGEESDLRVPVAEIVAHVRGLQSRSQAA